MPEPALADQTGTNDSRAMRWVIGVDIGGTFTDAVAVRLDAPQVITTKVRSTPEDLVEGVLEALEQVAGEAGLSIKHLLASTIKFAHGTTQTSNVMFTWSGAKTGLITTRGFGDELLIMRARGRVAGVSLAERRHFRATQKPPQIVPRHRIVEVSERIDHHGNVLVPLQVAEAERAVGVLLGQGVEAIAISLLWAHENPAHELLLEQCIRRFSSDIYVSSSHRVAPVMGEYERTATTAVNAYVGPIVTAYLERLGGRLAALGLRVPLLIVQASGGVVRSNHAVPVTTIESGPAAATVAVREVAARRGERNVIATDVGGTTFKVGLLVDGEWSFARETIINQYTLALPMIDLVSIGSGGGSVAWTDERRLRVGPQSAGANPGPACYGWGGEDPTVTDADLILGFIDPNRFLGGRLTLSLALATEAMRRAVADPLFGGDVIRAAAGVRQVVDSQMAGLVRRMTIERGHDPRTFMLMAYGGAGPVHAASYAAGLGIDRLVIPASAPAYSAYGAAASDIQRSLERPLALQLSDNRGAIENAYTELRAEAVELLSEEGIEPGRMHLRRWAELRYERQLHYVTISLPDGVGNESLERDIEAAFVARYSSLYGVGAVLGGVGIRLLRVGIFATGSITKPPVLQRPLGKKRPPADAALRQRDVYWPEQAAWLKSAVWNGDALLAGNWLEGPAIIEHSGTTIAIPAGATALIDLHGDTLVQIAANPEVQRVAS